MQGLRPENRPQALRNVNPALVPGPRLGRNELIPFGNVVKCSHKVSIYMDILKTRSLPETSTIYDANQ